MTTRLTIAVLVGTVRARRESIKAAHFVADYGKQFDSIDIVLVDPQELMLVDEGEDVKDLRYSDITRDADAFIIVTPEYNHGYPSSLKRMLDSEYANYFHKPVALVGVSSGSWGGVRACEQLLPVIHRLGLVQIQPELYFPRIQDLFDESGAMHAEHSEQYQKNTQKLYDELVWFATLLKNARKDTA